jgi:hypothetical protein
MLAKTLAETAEQPSAPATINFLKEIEGRRKNFPLSL